MRAPWTMAAIALSSALVAASCAPTTPTPSTPLPFPTGTFANRGWTAESKLMVDIEAKGVERTMNTWFAKSATPGTPTETGAAAIGNYTADSTTVTFTQSPAISPCGGAKGNYAWTLRDGTLTLSLKHDDCVQRRDVVLANDGRWDALSLTHGRDVWIYKNTFEQGDDPPRNGISSSTPNVVAFDSENVHYQSGSRSLRVDGVIATAPYSGLAIELAMRDLIGGDTIDLSNKTVGFSYYVPKGSKIESMGLTARTSAGEVTIAGRGGFDLNEWSPQRGRWEYVDFNVKDLYETGKWAYTDLEPDEARYVLRHCQTITIVGSVGEAGLPELLGPQKATFNIDDFKWIGLDDVDHIPLDDGVDSIRKYAKAGHTRMGSVLLNEPNTSWFDDPWYLQTLAQESDVVSVAAGRLPPDLDWDSGQQPARLSVDQIRQIAFDYEYSDPVLAFAEGNGLAVSAYEGGWHLMNPRWVLDASRDELEALLDARITQNLGRYKGKVLSWTVFNEVVDDPGDGFRSTARPGGDPPCDQLAPYGYHYSPWVYIEDGKPNTSLIEHAFIKAREVDPDTKLLLNDFYVEEIDTAKSEFFYNFVIDMKKRGIPIDGVGFELHESYPREPWRPALTNLDDLGDFMDSIDANIQRYAEAGLLVDFSEVEFFVRLDDIRNFTPDAYEREYGRRVELQEAFYAGLADLALKNWNVVAFTSWAVSDKLPGTSSYSGQYGYTDAFLFDKNHYPKPAYFALLGELTGRKPNPADWLPPYWEQHTPWTPIRSTRRRLVCGRQRMSPGRRRGELVFRDRPTPGRPSLGHP